MFCCFVLLLKYLSRSQTVERVCEDQLLQDSPVVCYEWHGAAFKGQNTDWIELMNDSLLTWKLCSLVCAFCPCEGWQTNRCSHTMCAAGKKKWFFIGYLRKWTFNHFLSLHTRGSVSSILWFWKLWPTAQNKYFNTSNSLGHNCQNLKQKSLKYFTLNVANLEYIKSFLNDKKP